jgi:hypothetical protein
MESLCRVSRGKTGEADTGKRDYRHREGLSFLNGIELAQAYPDTNAARAASQSG